MKIDILTLFPEMFTGPFGTSMLKKAKDVGAVTINIYNLRDWATDKHKSVDDRPFGGGVGMVIRVDVVNAALNKLRTEKLKNEETKTILLSPQGKVFNQKKARELSKLNHIILIAGHYEGFDERIREHLVDEEISIGDYVLTGGEIPAMTIVDSIVRLLPGVLDKEATSHESFSQPSDYGLQTTPLRQGFEGQALLDFPTYTRPENFKNWKVPRVLLGGNHKEIEKWRKEKAIETTKKKRPELLETCD